MFEEKENSHYEDIIHLPHHQSKTRPHMSIHDRAAQFSPFAALTGYEDAVKETARLTDQKIELSEETKSVLSEKLNLIRESMDQHPEVSITYFLEDEKKSGGAYVTEIGVVKRMDPYQRIVVMQNKRTIPVDDIVEIYGEIFKV